MLFKKIPAKAYPLLFLLLFSSCSGDSELTGTVIFQTPSLKQEIILEIYDVASPHAIPLYSYETKEKELRLDITVGNYNVYTRYKDEREKQGVSFQIRPQSKVEIAYKRDLTSVTYYK